MPAYQSILQTASELSQDDRIRLIEDLTDSLTEGGRTYLSLNKPLEKQSNRHYSIADVAQACGCSAGTVRRWFDSGRLRGYRIDGVPVVRIEAKHLKAFVDKHSQYKIKSKNLDIGSVFTAGQAAKLIGVTSRTVSRWVKTGKLNGYFIAGNKDRRVRHSDLAAFAKANKIQLANVTKASKASAA